MDTHLQKARFAMDRPERLGGQPKAEDVLVGMHEAITEILAYLEEQERKPVITVNGK